MTNTPFDPNVEPYKTMLNNGWMKLSDRNPDSMQACLVCSKQRQDARVRYWMPSDRNSGFEFVGGRDESVDECVTHWMAMPNPPKDL